MTNFTTERIFEALRTSIRRQYSVNSGVSLREIRDGKAPAYMIDPAIIAFVSANREGVLEVLQAELSRPRRGGLLDTFVAATRGHIHRNNQFLALAPEDEAGLAELYRKYMQGLVGVLTRAHRSTETAMMFVAAQEDHLERLRAYVAALAIRHGRPGASLIDRQVVCEEYSPEAQLRVLGLDLEVSLDSATCLPGPVIDVGCGRRGDLVRYLRSLGVEALGIDRQALETEYLVAADWLQYSFEEQQWGTIISHMAFSNHFIFHHVYSGGTPELYAARYMKILRSLIVGGSFIYSPGLPFMERLLPTSRYSVERTPVAAPPEWGAEVLDAHLGLLGETALYSARVKRLV